jgi:pilus assembly protein CpaF
MNASPTPTKPSRSWRSDAHNLTTPPGPAPTTVLRPEPSQAAAPSASDESARVIEYHRQRVHAAVVKTLDLAKLNTLPLERQRAELRTILTRLIDLSPKPLGPQDQERLLRELLNDILGFGPLEVLLSDPTINDILVNGPNDIFVERGGQLQPAEIRFRDNAHLIQVIDRIVSRVGRCVDETSPMVDARLPDGSRVNVIVPPLSVKWPCMSIRRFASGLRLDDLVRFQMLPAEVAWFLEVCVRSRLSTIVSGGTGSGKTTLLNTLSAFIPTHERIVTIEDAAELQLQQRHVVTLESRPPNIEGKGQVTTRDLLRNALRMRPDRIIVGECRGPEALDMLQAMNTGHDGSLTTLHANSARDALSRLETMVLMAGFDLPARATRGQIASAVRLIVQTARLSGGVRRVTSVTEVVGMEGDAIVTQEVFAYRQTGTDSTGRAIGQFVATGVRPQAAERLKTCGVEIPPDLFHERVIARDH